MPSNSIIAALVALIGLTLLVFGIWPGIDLAVSGFFHDASLPGASGFAVRHIGWIEALRNLIWDGTLLMPLLAAVLLGWSLWRKTSGWFWGYILALFLIGPGLIVNAGFKAYWGRARPSNVIDFGGTAQFTPAWQISDQCAKNCSFVSGEGAGATALTIALILILLRYRSHIAFPLYRAAQALTLASLAFVGWQRIAAGGHFLSDVLLSALLVSLIAAILARLMLNQATSSR
ncbi:MAG: phosphatase PAP2 family protein [Pseudomonadota bacterium]